jgi:glycosyltransferase involved in cell wall biosynthesis
MTPPSEIPSFEPLAQDAARPAWSVMIPTYNCAAYLREALASVLQQDPGPDRMQIEVIDDCSTRDDPEAVVREMAPGRVTFYRQPQNVGAIPNFNTCIRRARGEHLHILHGDDTVLYGFYKHAEKAYREHPEIGAVLTCFIWMDSVSNWKSIEGLLRLDAGVIDNFGERLIVYNAVQCPAITVRRTVYEKIGGFDPRFVHAADWDMWKRIAFRYPVWYVPTPLACYRYHGQSDTEKLIRDGRNIAERRQAIEVSRAYLPPGSELLLAKARKTVAMQALSTAGNLLSRDRLQTAGVQVREALKTSTEPAVIFRLVALLPSAVWHLLLLAARKLFRRSR